MNVIFVCVSRQKNNYLWWIIIKKKVKDVKGTLKCVWAADNQHIQTQTNLIGGKCNKSVKDAIIQQNNSEQFK